MGQSAAEYVNPATLTPWARNPRKNDPAVPAAMESIKRFGWGAPVLARHLPDGSTEIIAGHTRIKAAVRLKLAEVPVRWMDHLSDSEAHALALADNKIGELAEWDVPELAAILRDLEADGEPLDGLGWDKAELDALLGDGSDAAPEKYTSKIETPVYEPRGERPAIPALYDRTRTEKLVEAIDAADLPPDVAAFLRLSAERHTVFHFKRIAEYYCHAPAEVQALMEQSAMIIIDYGAAIDSGFVKLTERLGLLADEEAGAKAARRAAKEGKAHAS